MAFFEQANLHYSTTKFTTKFTSGNLPAHTFSPLSPTHLSKEKFEESISNFQKPLMDRGYQHNLKEKLLSEICKTHRNWNFAILKQNSKEGKEMLPFPDTIPVLGVHKKRSFYGKVESDPKPTTTLSYKERKNHGKEHASSVRAKIFKVNTRFHPGIDWMCIL